MDLHHSITEVAKAPQWGQVYGEGQGTGTGTGPVLLSDGHPMTGQHIKVITLDKKTREGVVGVP